MERKMSRMEIESRKVKGGEESDVKRKKERKKENKMERQGY